METKSLLSSALIEGALDRLPGLGLGAESILRYKRSYGRIMHFFGTENMSSYTETMHDRFMKHVEESTQWDNMGEHEKIT